MTMDNTQDSQSPTIPPFAAPAGSAAFVCECGEPMAENRVVCDKCESMDIALARTFGLPMPDEADYLKPPNTKLRRGGPNP